MIIEISIYEHLLCASEEGTGNPLQYSCLENLMDRGAWQTTVHSRVCKESDMTVVTWHNIQTLLSDPEFGV